MTNIAGISKPAPNAWIRIVIRKKNGELLYDI